MLAGGTNGNIRGVQAAEEGRNVKNQADCIDDAFQPNVLKLGNGRLGYNTEFERKSLTQCITQGIWNAFC